ncbi:6-hydroxynicotinate 3-monooxygenase [Apiospora marii]|uniref:6-hydroxynicotinate 3-monooxygenase n=1 Tax=Apiospora marii TaxID=335849 RepID=A0ABR1R190_9PEZI
MADAKKNKFKAIIIGGGPVGMYLAHALQTTGIDYVLCEKRDAIPPSTAFGLFLWPHGLRLLHQVGLLDRTEAISSLLTKITHAGPKGDVMREYSDFGFIHLAHGYPVRMFDRASLGQMLYDALREPAAHVRTGKQLVDIERRAGGVTAHFADGTREEGSIVIGADGIWSTVRDLMRRDAPEGLFDAVPFSANYRAVFGRSPLPSRQPGSSSGLELEQQFEFHRDGALLQLFTSKREVHFISYLKLDQPRRERSGFDETIDASDAAVAPWLDTRVAAATGLTFRDLWQTRAAAGGANLDEGVVRMWHWGRTVLVGDAAHKVLPNQGMGANGGFEGAASLVNQLTALLRHEPDPNAAAFAAYQAERQGVMGAYRGMARDELAGWTREGGRRWTRCVRRIPMVSRAVRLDAVPFPGERVGLAGWGYKVPAEAARAAGGGPKL